MALPGHRERQLHVRDGEGWSAVPAYIMTYIMTYHRTFSVRLYQQFENVPSNLNAEVTANSARL